MLTGVAAAKYAGPGIIISFVITGVACTAGVGAIAGITTVLLVLMYGLIRIIASPDARRPAPVQVPPAL